MWRERRGEGEKEEVEACDIANVDEVVKGCVREGDGDASCREGMEAAEAGRQGEEGGNAVDWGAEDVARENHGECEGWLRGRSGVREGVVACGREGGSNPTFCWPMKSHAASSDAVLDAKSDTAIQL